MASSSRKEIACLIAATLAMLAPFLGKPLNVDDALFYWIARHIAVAPLDPYGFDVNWYLTTMPMAEVTKNPPGAAYLLAAAGLLLGWSPVALHLVFLVPAVGVVVGTWALARRFSSRPFLAGLLVLASPGFVTSATTVMSDALMLALSLAALVLWIRQDQRDMQAYCSEPPRSRRRAC
jgi:4-amino-4-deoxy-L-arabinose transferase-like glycosyltransferase